MSRGKELTKNTLIITAGRVATQFVSFLLLPLYTTLLTTEEFGTVDFIMTLVSLLVPVVSLMIDQGVFRNLLGCETEEEKTRVISSAYMSLFISSAAAVSFYLALSPFIKGDHKLWLLLILIATSFSNLSLQTARGLRHTADYALGSFVCSAVTITLNVVCIAFMKMGAQGMLIASFTGNLICSLFLFIRLKIWRYTDLKAATKAIAAEELRYSVPLVPNQLSLWVMNSSDRLIVTFFLGAASNGILAISHKFPAIYMTFYNIFQLAWHETGAIHYFDEDRDEFFSDIINRLVTLFSTLCIGVIAVLPAVFDVLIGDSFRGAYYNIPIYLIASLFNVVIGLLGVVYVATRKTAEIAKTTLLAAVINIIVNLSLIGRLGLYAASLSTLAGYLVTMVYRLIDTRKYLTISWDRKRLISIGVLLSISTGIYYLHRKNLSLIFLSVFIVIAYLMNRPMIDQALETISSKTKISSKKLFGMIIAVILAGMAVLTFMIPERPLPVTERYSGKIEPLEPYETVMLEDDFTCTGIASDKDHFYICDHDTNSIIAFDKNFERKDSISVKNITDLQGIASDDGFWLAADDVIHIDRDGNTKSLGLEKYDPNGICKDGDTLWVVAKKHLLNIDKTGKILKKFPFYYKGQDHIFKYKGRLYITAGTDYRGDDNFLCVVSPDTGKIEKIYRLKGSHSVEGIVIENGNIYITNDGKFHKDLKGHSYVTIYKEREK